MRREALYCRAHVGIFFGSGPCRRIHRRLQHRVTSTRSETAQKTRMAEVGVRRRGPVPTARRRWDHRRIAPERAGERNSSSFSSGTLSAATSDVAAVQAPRRDLRLVGIDHPALDRRDRGVRPVVATQVGRDVPTGRRRRSLRNSSQRDDRERCQAAASRDCAGAGCRSELRSARAASPAAR